MVQISRTQFDSDVAFVSNENLDFTAEQDLDGYNDIEIALTAPTNAAITLAIKVYAKSNNKLVALTGLAKEDFLLKVDGVTVTIIALAAGSVDGEYTLTSAAYTTGEIITLQLFDATLNASIINLDGTMYKSNVATKPVV